MYNIVKYRNCIFCHITHFDIMGRLFEDFQILFTDYDYILGKWGVVFKGGLYIRGDIIQGNTVCTT